MEVGAKPKDQSNSKANSTGKGQNMGWTQYKPGAGGKGRYEQSPYLHANGFAKQSKIHKI